VGATHRGGRAAKVDGMRGTEPFGLPAPIIDFVVRDQIQPASRGGGPARRRAGDHAGIDIVGPLNHGAGRNVVLLMGNEPPLVHRLGRVTMVVEDVLSRGRGSRAILGRGDRRQSRGALLDLDSSGMPGEGETRLDRAGTIVMAVLDLFGDGVEILVGVLGQNRVAELCRSIISWSGTSVQLVQTSQPP
jgi:hypothetical protein